MNFVRHHVGIPSSSDFANGEGTPIVLDTATGSAYCLTDDGVVQCLGGLATTVAGVGDGTTSDQTVVAAAVARAYAAGHELYWPDGTYLTTASIPNFHDVRHRGPGVMKRGSTSFYVDPTFHPGVTNNLYVATTGDNANDGLTSALPRLTVQSMGDVIYKYSYSDITWKVNVAAGTYVATTYFSKKFPTPNRVQFVGAAVANGTTPTTIFDSPGGADQSGLYFQGDGMRAYVEDILFTDYKDGGAVSFSGNGVGIRIDGHAEVYTKNIYASVCDVGVKTAFLSQLRAEAGVLNACAIGFTCIANSQFTIGYNGTAASITGNTGVAITGCNTGILVQEQSSGHADYCYFGTNSTGLKINTNSRCHALGSSFVSNTVAVEAETNATYYDNPSIPNTYTTNTTNFSQLSGAIRTGVLAGENFRGPWLIEVDTAGASTQSATPVEFYTKSFAQHELAVRGAMFRFTIYGEVVGVADTKTIVIAFGGTTLLTATIAAATTDYKIVVNVVNRTGASSQKYFTEIYQNGVLTVSALNITALTLDFTSAARTFNATHQVTNGADLNRIGWVQMEIVH